MEQQPEATAVINPPAAPLMGCKKNRVLLLCSHPTQYGSPLWRRFSQDPRLDVVVAYCSMQGAEAQMDPDFGVKVAWDIPLLDDYLWVQIKNISPQSRIDGFFGRINPGVWNLIRRGRFDAIAIFTGYVCATFWIAVAAAKSFGIPVLYGTDAVTLRPVNGRAWKARVKKHLWPRLFRIADIVTVPSSGSAALMLSLKIPPERIKIMPYVVDNLWWIEKSRSVDRARVRASWKIPNEATVVLFCAKLQPWKRPQDLLRAFARVNIFSSYLVYAGDGAMRNQLQIESEQLGVADRVRFLGFVNQSVLPEVYSSSDVMVLPSAHEPFGVVVNESMLCGCPVVVSDQVGARADLVRDGETGFVFPAESVDELSKILSQALRNRAELRRMGEFARLRMTEWSPETNLQAFIEAIELAVRHKKMGYKP